MSEQIPQVNEPDRSWGRTLERIVGNQVDDSILQFFQLLTTDNIWIEFEVPHGTTPEELLQDDTKDLAAWVRNEGNHNKSRGNLVQSRDALSGVTGESNAVVRMIEQCGPYGATATYTEWSLIDCSSGVTTGTKGVTTISTETTRVTDKWAIRKRKYVSSWPEKSDTFDVWSPEMGQLTINELTQVLERGADGIGTLSQGLEVEIRPIDCNRVLRVRRNLTAPANGTVHTFYTVLRYTFPGLLTPFVSTELTAITYSSGVERFPINYDVRSPFSQLVTAKVTNWLADTDTPWTEGDGTGTPGATGGTILKIIPTDFRHNGPLLNIDVRQLLTNNQIIYAQTTSGNPEFGASGREEAEIPASDPTYSTYLGYVGTERCVSYSVERWRFGKFLHSAVWVTMR